MRLLNFCRRNQRPYLRRSLIRRWYALSLGLVSITFPLQAQPDTVAQWLDTQFSAVETAYYYQNLDSALSGYRQIAKLAETHSLWYLALEAEIQMAWCAMHHQRLDLLPRLLSDAEETILEHQTALDTLDPDYTLRLNVPYTWGLYYTYTEDQTKAIEAYQDVLADKRVLADSSLVSDTYYAIATSYDKLGNYQQAITYHQRATTWIPREAYGSQYSYHKALALRALGTSYLNQGLYKKDSLMLSKVKPLFSESLQLLAFYKNEERGRHAILAGYRALANWYRIEKDYDKALDYLQQSSAFFKPPEPELIETYRLWGDVYLEKSQFDKAREYYQEALSIATRAYGNKNPRKADILQRIANSYSHQKQWSEALLHLQQALEQSANNFSNATAYLNPTIDQLTPPNRFLLDILLLKAEVLYQLSQADHPKALLAALDTYHLATVVLDKMRQTFPSLEYKQFVSAKAASLYEQAIRASLRAHELGLTQKDFLAEAFYFSEKGKAATLLEAVKTHEARAFAGISAALLAQENKLKRELTYWENELYHADNDSTQQALRTQAFAARESYNLLVNRLEREYPHYYQLKYDTEVVGLSTLQRGLAPGAALLSFVYGDSTIYAFTIRRDTVQYYSIQRDDAFLRALEYVLQTISRYDYKQVNDANTFQQFTTAAFSLYQTLVQPSLVSSPSAVEQLAIIPDGMLGYLPFDVLLTHASVPTSVDYQRLPYLVKQLPVRYEYSATLFAKAAAPRQEGLYSYLGFAPTYPEAPLAESREVRTTLDGTLLGLEQLRYNHEEVAYAANLFQGKAFTDQEATETRFKEQAATSRLLHLSMHAYAHDKNDNFSGLIFSQQAGSKQEDGFLHANELYSLSLNAELAVLSACETGIGTLAPGEGIMSLGRAFKYAGCPNVTMSLWNADDQSTNHIMQHFFTHLHKGTGKDRALQQAKLEYLTQAKSAQAHPYYWAAFVQVGNNLPLSSASSPAVWRWIAGGIVLLLIAGWLMLFRKRNAPGIHS